MKRSARDAVTPDKVVQTAMAIVQRSGVAALTLRSLTAELGVQAPTIYWHVGNREALLKLLIDRVADELGAITPMGDTPAQRIASILDRMLGEVRARPHLIELTAALGRHEVVFTRAEELLTREVLATGLAGRQAALAVSTIMFNFGGFLLLEHALAEDHRLHGVDRWEDAGEIDAEMRTALEAGVDLDEVYRLTVEALLEKLLPPS